MSKDSKKTIAKLEQFNENGKKITWMYAFSNKYDDGVLPNAYAVFKIYRKDKRTFLQKVFPVLERKMLSKKMIASQSVDL